MYASGGNNGLQLRKSFNQNTIVSILSGVFVGNGEWEGWILMNSFLYSLQLVGG